MKKILSEWKKYIKESVEQDDLLDKVRDIFFGAYNTWEPEYKELHDDMFTSYYEQMVKNANQRFDDKEKIDKVLRGGDIGLSLYWSDNPQHGVGSSESVGFLIEKKFNILESRLTEDEKNQLKTGMMNAIIDSVSGDRSNQMYPTGLAVSVGVINGIQVDDAYMSTGEGLSRFVIPILQSKGYYTKSSKPRKPQSSRRKKYEPEMSPEDLKAMMDKFSR